MYTKLTYHTAVPRLNHSSLLSVADPSPIIRTSVPQNKPQSLFQWRIRSTSKFLKSVPHENVRSKLKTQKNSPHVLRTFSCGAPRNSKLFNYGVSRIFWESKGGFSVLFMGFPGGNIFIPRNFQERKSSIKWCFWSFWRAARRRRDFLKAFRASKVVFIAFLFEILEKILTLTQNPG